MPIYKSKIVGTCIFEHELIVHSHRYTPYRACIYRFFRIISYYARKYFVPKYISQPRPSQRPQSRGNTLEPGDGHRTIPSNGGELLTKYSTTSIFNHLGYITYGIFWQLFDNQMHMIRVYCNVNDLNTKLSTRLPDNCLG